MSAISQNTIFVTGGAGFIGANFVLDIIAETNYRIVNLDLLTYAGNLGNLSTIIDNPRHIFIQGDINDKALIQQLLIDYQPQAIINFAAESHVDRSIMDASQFIQTNIVGTYNLLAAARSYYTKLTNAEQQSFRFIQIGTDEVFGSLEPAEAAFTEENSYKPNSPYSASKAAADHLVRAWYHTYKLPTIITNCSNNYGPYQFPEKLIPLVLSNALEGKLLPLYSRGENIRDWLFVKDHSRAIMTILINGSPGQTYNIGGNNEKTNLEVVQIICALLDKILPVTASLVKHPETEQLITSYSELISFVPDRLGHDARYAINANKMQQELGWKPLETFDSGIIKTVQWYIDNKAWVSKIKNRQII